jgi:hypothetical protein
MNDKRGTRNDERRNVVVNQRRNAVTVNAQRRDDERQIARLLFINLQAAIRIRHSSLLRWSRACALGYTVCFSVCGC